MLVEREKCKIQRGVRDTGVRLKYGSNTEHGRCDEERLPSQAYAKATHVRGQMQPEDSKKELSEGVKHFNEEIPPESDIWSEIGHE